MSSTAGRIICLVQPQPPSNWRDCVLVAAKVALGGIRTLANQKLLPRRKVRIRSGHFECRGTPCIHRQFFTVIRSQLFCARVPRKQSPSENVLIDGALIQKPRDRRRAVWHNLHFQRCVTFGLIDVERQAVLAGGNVERHCFKQVYRYFVEPQL